MGKLWCAGFPWVSIKRGEPKHVTFVYPYYENPEFLAYQLDRWAAYPVEIQKYLSAIIVDDGSPELPAENVLRGRGQPFPLSLYRIEIDVRWNWLAARNIGFHHAPEGWVLVTDMDHVVPPETVDTVIHGHFDEGRIYCFARAEHTGAQANPHSASFLMTRALFWRIGGYDERMSGFYGSDGYWRRRCAAKAKFQMLHEKLIRHEFVGDSSTIRYERKAKQDAGLRRLARTFPKGSKPKTLSFPYHRVAL